MTRAYAWQRDNTYIQPVPANVPVAWPIGSFGPGDTLVRARCVTQLNGQVTSGQNGYPVPWQGIQATLALAFSTGPDGGTPPLGYYGYESTYDWTWAQQVCWVNDAEYNTQGFEFPFVNYGNTVESRMIDSHSMRIVPPGEYGALYMVFDSFLQDGFPGVAFQVGVLSSGSSVLYKLPA